ncbi:MAG: chromate transporter [Clostridiales bacterium]|jgi:chromate transporter|nr:chromate transporter [Clostridiales bacterium]
MKNKKDLNIYIDLFITFFKLGLFTIGGGMAMIPILEDIVVRKKKWLTLDEATDCIAISQSLPGVIAINMATYVGRFKKGLRGSIVATIGVIIPSFIAIILIATILSDIRDNTYVNGAFIGLKAAAVGMIIWAVIKIGKGIFNDVMSWIIGIASFVAIWIFNVNVIYVVITTSLIGVAYIKISERGKVK